jgi:hypothetical protein
MEINESAVKMMVDDERMAFDKKAARIQSSSVGKANEMQAELRKWNIIFWMLAALAAVCLITASLIFPSENPIVSLLVFLLGLLFTACAGVIARSKIPKLRWQLEQAFGKC